MRVDDAWYSGDRARLISVHQDAAEQRRRGFLRRLWDRRPADQSRPRDGRLHIPLAGDIAATSARLLYAKMPAITVTNAPAQARLETLLDECGVHQTLMHAAEQSAAMSGVFLRVTWNRDRYDRPLLTVQQPDQAIPEFLFGDLWAVTFWRELPGSGPGTVWRHLERHEKGRITHALYQGTKDNLGARLPIAAHPDTAALVTADKTAPGTDGVVSTGLSGMTAVYIPNLLPNRLNRNSPCGRSDFSAPIYDLFDALDETWTSWIRDLRLARARLVVPDGYLTNFGPGQGAGFDDDREVYQGLKIAPGDPGSGITIAQFAIRVEEHARTAEAIVRQATGSAGYSPHSFGLDREGPAVTATEIEDRARKSLDTRTQKAGYNRGPLAQILGTLLEADAKLFGRPHTAERPAVEFGPAVSESMQSRATTVELMGRAQAASHETKVRYLHPEWDQTQVAAEVAAIVAETGVPDPVGNFPM
ncbi:phage capsid protein [Streptomyces sp. LE64]|uniref:phage capsid protein n=1 Tax=Streptomyces sp. LE64 TaxID=3448653 RepID=UPI00404270B4